MLICDWFILQGMVELVNVSSSAEPIRTKQVEEQVSLNSRGDLNPASRYDGALVMKEVELSDDAAASEAYNGDCSAARVRALVSCKRRRLVQPGALRSLDNKVCVHHYTASHPVNT